MRKRLGIIGLLISGFLYISNFSTLYAAEYAADLENYIPSSLPASGRTTDILPADVLARSLLFRDELDLIRVEMGKPKTFQNEINVTDAAPREVFFQTQTLFRKSDLLAFEFLGGYVSEAKMPGVDEIKPLDVWRMLDSALKRVIAVKHYLGIKEQSIEVERDIKTTPTQVFKSIVQVNRQINLLLERKMAPSDVFERTSSASNYAVELLSRFPDAVQRPLPMAFERGKAPPDVYRRLLSIFDNVREIYEASGLQMLKISVTEEEIKSTVPSDVYDIASLLVSELSYIHSKTSNQQTPAKAYYPGKKFPSHVYQRAGVLEQQIRNLLARVKDNPQWMDQ